MPIYAEHHVVHAWLVDPLAKMLEAYRLDLLRWLQIGAWAGNACMRAEPFEAVELELGALRMP
jgi:hypothetical protein